MLLYEGGVCGSIVKVLRGVVSGLLRGEIRGVEDRYVFRYVLVGSGLFILGFVFI